MTQPQEEVQDAAQVLYDLIEKAEETDHHGDICYGLIHGCGMADNGHTYAWFGMLSKRYSMDACRAIVVGLLERGIRVDDFDDVKQMRSYVTSAIRNQHARPHDNTLEMFT